MKTLQVDEQTHYDIKLQCFKEGISIKEMCADMIKQRKKNYNRLQKENRNRK